MSESYNFDYYYGAESDQFSFVRIPKLLLSDPKFADLTYGAILTYGILLDRMGLSIKNGWHDENNRVYIRFKVEDLSEILGKSDDTVSGYLKELEKIGLVERDWRGAGKGKITYVKNFISPNLRDGEFITRINSGNGNPKTAPAATIKILLNCCRLGTFSFRTISIPPTNIAASTVLPKPTTIVPKYSTATLVDGKVKLKHMTPTKPNNKPNFSFSIYFPPQEFKLSENCGQFVIIT